MNFDLVEPYKNLEKNYEELFRVMSKKLEGKSKENTEIDIICLNKIQKHLTKLFEQRNDKNTINEKVSKVLDYIKSKRR